MASDSDPAPTSFLVGVPSTYGADTYGYVLRLGTADAALEGAADASKSPVKPNQGNWPTGTGALLYAKDTISLIAPALEMANSTSTSWSTDDLSVTTDPSFHGAVQTATWSTGGVQMNYVSEIQSNFVNGAVTNTIAGLSTNIITGVNSYSIGGLSLTATAGINAAVTSGIAVTINNNDAVVATRNGSVSVSTSSLRNAADSIDLYAGSPAALAAREVIDTASLIVQGINVAVQTASAVNAAATGIALDFEARDLKANSDDVRNILKAQGTAANLCAYAMLLAQMYSLVAALTANQAVKKAGGTTAISALKLGTSGTSLSFGGASLTMGAGSIPPPAFDNAVAAATAALAAAATPMDNYSVTGDVFDLLAESSPQQDAATAALEAANLAKATAAAALPVLKITSNDIDIVALSSISIAAVGSITLSVGESAIEISPEGVKIAGPTVGVDSSEFQSVAELVRFQL